MSLTKNEIQVLRTLAFEYMELARLPVQREKLDLWKALNRNQMQRPMVCIDQLPWNELNYDDSLTVIIKEPYWAQVELGLRKKIFGFRHFPVDMVLEPYITIPKVITSSGYAISAKVERISLSEGTTASSQHYENILKEYDDIKNIKDMDFLLDVEKSDERFLEAQNIFGDISPLVQGHGVSFHLGVWDFLTTLMSVENAYLDLLDRPEFIHACMERITDAAIAGIKKANDLNIHDDISNLCHCSYTYNDELLPDFGAGCGPVSKNSWAFGMAQLFTSVSPDITSEFELPYISKMASHFGMIYYGCCDRLDDRLDIIKKIPNLKKISCSPWSDRKKFAQEIGRNYTMSFKPSPAFIAGDQADWDQVKKDLEHTVSVAKENNVNLEIILKDISTVNCRPDRLTKWADIAMNLVNNY